MYQQEVEHTGNYFYVCIWHIFWEPPRMYTGKAKPSSTNQILINQQQNNEECWWVGNLGMKYTSGIQRTPWFGISQYISVVNKLPCLRCFVTAVQMDQDNHDAKDRYLHFPMWKCKVTMTNGSPGKTCVGQAIEWDPDPTREMEWSCQDDRLVKDARHGSNIWAVPVPSHFLSWRGTLL